MRPSRKMITSARYGVGVVWWPELDTLCESGAGLVHVLEVEPEPFWVPRAASALDLHPRFPNCSVIGRCPNCCMASARRSVAV
jgi:hypothetical protein